MKNLFFLCFVLIIFGFETQDKKAFDVGEYFKFRVHYGFINAGYATLEVKESEINQKNWLKSFLSLIIPKCIKTKKPSQTND